MKFVHRCQNSPKAESWNAFFTCDLKSNPSLTCKWKWGNSLVWFPFSLNTEHFVSPVLYETANKSTLLSHIMSLHTGKLRRRLLLKCSDLLVIIEKSSGVPACKCTRQVKPFEASVAWSKWGIANQRPPPLDRNVSSLQVTRPPPP